MQRDTIVSHNTIVAGYLKVSTGNNTHIIYSIRNGITNIIHICRNTFQDRFLPLHLLMIMVILNYSSNTSYGNSGSYYITYLSNVRPCGIGIPQGDIRKGQQDTGIYKVQG